MIFFCIMRTSFILIAILSCIRVLRVSCGLVPKSPINRLAPQLLLYSDTGESTLAKLKKYPRYRRNADHVESEEDLHEAGTLNQTNSAPSMSTTISHISIMDNPMQQARLQNEKVISIDDSRPINAETEDTQKAPIKSFWNSVFCVIFVIIVVYSIYSYTHCRKRKDSESVSTKQFADSGWRRSMSLKNRRQWDVPICPQEDCESVSESATITYRPNTDQ